MRKFLFGALACVAFAGSSFASSEVSNASVISNEEISIVNLKSEAAMMDLVEAISSEEKRPCSYSFWAIDHFGELVKVEGATEVNVTKDDCKTSSTAWFASNRQLYQTVFPSTYETLWGEII